ncbi:hypothetical protein [Sphingomonas dokdonensis]|uniref:Uncharacterized protein n=1 Tax=Sphingomonas dokdonensis TaxID=344880 RepID=A0A245ZL40_9SPHN|nr:hypothetical protein [Sphingomonas dokdonensis]OWK30457.1 hypothetical protein SPDO_21440 [Sphingomonas dokdonensis]
MIALLRAVAGLIVWAVAFSAIYGAQGLVCARGWQDVAIGPVGLGRALLIALWLAFCAVLGRMTWRLRCAWHGGVFLDRLAAASAVVGLISTVYTGLPVVATAVCR